MVGCRLVITLHLLYKAYLPSAAFGRDEENLSHFLQDIRIHRRCGLKLPLGFIARLALREVCSI